MAGPGRLTTHVLDTANGRPAAGLAVTLYRLEGEARVRLAEAVTNADGRCDAPLLEGEAMEAGEYVIAFDVGGYFQAAGQVSPFLSSVPVQFLIAATDQHYHVPLLVSPFGYSTYRGS